MEGKKIIADHIPDKGVISNININSSYNSMAK